MTSYERIDPYSKPFRTSNYFYLKNIDCRAPGRLKSLLFSKNQISNFVHISKPISHRGCVNTVKWTADGNFLVTGSDDRTVKIWNSSCLPDLTLKQTINTTHFGNIFGAEISPFNSSMLVSCGADGVLIVHDINDPRAEIRARTSDDMIHMFQYCRYNPNIVYTAEEYGTIQRVDTRSKTSSTVEEAQSSVKYLIQPMYGFENNLLYGESNSLYIKMIDTRFMKNNTYVALWYPDINPSHMNSIYSSLYQARYETNKVSNASVSGMSFNSDGSRFLVNYQNGQIYEYDFNPYKIDKQINSAQTHDGLDDNGPYFTAVRMWGGHINHNTFLKSVSYFGPRDEYIVAGSDSGHMWIWDAQSGSLGTSIYEPPFIQTCDVVNFLRADSKTCNGVAPHPHLPYLVSYGLESTAKLWGYPTSDNRESVTCAFSCKVAKYGSCCCSDKCQYSHSDFENLEDNLEFTKFKGTAQQVNNFIYGYTASAIRRRLKSLNNIKFNQDAEKDLGPIYPSDFVLDYPLAFPEREQLEFIFELFEYTKIEDESLQNIDTFIESVLSRIKRCDLNWKGLKSLDFCHADEKDDTSSINIQEKFKAAFRLMLLETSDNSIQWLKMFFYRASVEIHCYYIAIAAKQNGTAAFKKNDFKKSIFYYRKAIRYAQFLYYINKSKFDNNFVIKEVAAYYTRQATTDEQLVDHASTISNASINRFQVALSWLECPYISDPSLNIVPSFENMSNDNEESRYLSVLLEIHNTISKIESSINTSAITLIFNCMNNIVLSLIQMKAFKEARAMSDRAKQCEDSMGLAQPDVKLLYRRGLIFMELKEYLMAVEELQIASKLQPADANIAKRLRESKAALEDERKKIAAKYSKMFS